MSVAAAEVPNPEHTTWFSPQVAALRACPYFSSQSVVVLAALGRSTSIRHIPPRTTCFRRGEPWTNALLPIRGCLRAVHGAASGREVTLETFRAGDLLADGVLGEIESHEVDLVTTEGCVLLLVPREAFLAHLRAFPDCALMLGRDLLRRVRSHRQAVALLALGDVATRLEWMLGELARREGRATADGTLLPRRPTQEELAAMVGARRETVSRIMAGLARRGLVSVRGCGLLLAAGLQRSAALP